MVGADRRPDGPATEGLRERKKRVLREQMSDTATRLFLERGFDAVRVADVARACDVSEKTVYNHFPTKEALVLDRLQSTVGVLRTELARPDLSPLQAALAILERELAGITAGLVGPEGRSQALTGLQRFGDLLQATPSLRAHQGDMINEFTAVAARTIAERIGTDPDDPEVQIAARAILGLWHVQAQSLRRRLHDVDPAALDPARLREAITSDVRRAARIVEHGLRALPALAP